jgi:CheY-like chemotaxis protein
MIKKTLCKSILIADDNGDIRDTIEDTLKSAGYEVFAEKDGKEALKRLKMMKSPTLVLLDLMMPVMSGWEFLDAQKSDAVLKPHQVVTISSISSTASIEDPAPLETAGTLQKPICLEPLLKMVQQFCGMPSEA